MAGTFGRQMQELSDTVGMGFCVGKVTVDQVYAHYQHERLDLKHPRGGIARYLSVPLIVNRNAYFTAVAKTALQDGGVRGMAQAVEHLAGGTSYSTAPIREEPGVLGPLTRFTDTGGAPTVGESGAPGEWGVAALAPVLFGDLRDSGHPQVFSPSGSVMGSGVPRYDRPPRTKRLTEFELKAKARLLPMDPRLIGWIWWHVMGETHPPRRGEHGSGLLRPDLHRPGFRRRL